MRVPVPATLPGSVVGACGFAHPAPARPQHGETASDRPTLRRPARCRVPGRVSILYPLSPLPRSSRRRHVVVTLLATDHELLQARLQVLPLLADLVGLF